MLQIFAEALLIAVRMEKPPVARRQNSRDTGGTRKTLPLGG